MSQLHRMSCLTLLLLLSLPMSGAVKASSHSPETLWQSLMAGNQRFVDGHLSYTKLRAQRATVAPAQNPRISILSCADSRVPPELIFDKSVGELFVVRVAGNLTDPFGVASLEFAIANGYTDLIVVLGHESCGAVKAAMSEANPGTPSLDALVARIRESFDSEMNRDAKDTGAVQHATEVNAQKAARDLVEGSEIIRKAVAEGRVTIVSAYYDLDTGKVQKLK